MDRTVGSTVNFTCNDGYILFGPATRNCTSLGSWTGITPSCISMFTSVCMHIYKIMTMYDIPYSRIHVIYVLRPCAIGFALRNVHDIFLRKWLLVVFNICVACHNFKTTVRNYSVTRQMPSIAILASLILSVSSRVLVKSSFRAPIFYLGS